jgi:hypothetical protein
MKKFIIFLSCVYFELFSISAFSQSLKPLNQWVNENSNYLDNPADQIYLLNRCAAVNAYIGAISQNNPDKSVTQKASELYDLFAETSLNISKNKLRISSENALKTFSQNLKNMVLLYDKDGQVNYARMGDYTKGYIFDDLSLCAKLGLKK